MQIRGITANTAGMAAGRSIQGEQPRVQAANNLFGAECRVTISREGRRLSRQQAAHTEKGVRSVQSVKAERMLLRRQEEAEQAQKVKEGYRQELDEIDKKIKALNGSYTKKNDMDIIEKKQEVLDAMRSQKEFLAAENQRLAKEAQQAAMQFAGYQDEIDENNRELLTLLRTMEEAEKTEEEREGGEAQDVGSDGGASGAKVSAGDVIQATAAQFTASSLRRVCGVEEAIAGLSEEGHWYLDKADAITQNVLGETASIRTALDDGTFTDEQIADMLRLLRDGTTNAELADEFKKHGIKTGMELNYKDVESYRGRGLQLLQDAQECRIQHLADNPPGGMQEAGRSMVLSAVDAAFGEAVQSSLNEASRELEGEVEKLIDRRNEVDRIPQDKEEDEEEQWEQEEASVEQT